jgi:hypothetical protein
MVEFSRSRPHRLVAQDVALSRPKHQFEPGWGHLRRPIPNSAFFYYPGGKPASGWLKSHTPCGKILSKIVVCAASGVQMP